MKKGLTEMVFILDRSGSMHGLEADSVGGFNSMIEKQKAEEGEALVSTVLFSHSSDVLYDRVPLDKISPMQLNDFRVGGNTALMDALGDAIHHIGNVHKYAREEDVPESTVFVIMTDGMENASMRYSSEEVKRLITRQKEKYGWEFLFLAANIDAVETAARYGIDSTRTVEYAYCPTGMREGMMRVNKAVRNVRRRETLNSEGWKDLAGEDKEAFKAEPEDLVF